MLSLNGMEKLAGLAFDRKSTEIWSFEYEFGVHRIHSARVYSRDVALICLAHKGS